MSSFGFYEMTLSYKLQHKSDYNGSHLIFIWLSVTMVTSHNGDDGHTTIRLMNSNSDVSP